MSEARRIKTALVSVYHKEGLDEIITKLHEEGVQFLSTGGTRQFIESLGYPCQAVEDLTSYPSILGGRVKTLHPKVFGGILCRRELEQDMQQIEKYEIPEIYCPIIHNDFRPFENACLIHYAGKEYKYFIDRVWNEKTYFPVFTITLKYCKQFYQKVADLLDVEIQTKYLDIKIQQNVLAKKRVIKTLEKHLLRIKEKLKNI